MIAQSGVGLHLLAAAHALGIVVALPVAIRVAAASLRAARVALAEHGIALRGASSACARREPKDHDPPQA
jgi:hypothetical protein